MSLIDVIFKKNALPKVPASLKELVGEIRGIKTAIADLWRSMTNAEGNINRLDEAVEADENTLGDITRHKVYLTGSTLSQSMMSKENTIYVVKDDLTLSEDITIPANCVLEFEGGSLRSNDTVTINGQGACIVSPLNQIFYGDVILSNFKESLHAAWFGDGDNLSFIINNLSGGIYHIDFDGGTFTIESPFVLKDKFLFNGIINYAGATSANVFTLYGNSGIESLVINMSTTNFSGNIIYVDYTHDDIELVTLPYNIRNLHIYNEESAPVSGSSCIKIQISKWNVVGNQLIQNIWFKGYIDNGIMIEPISDVHSGNVQVSTYNASVFENIEFYSANCTLYVHPVFINTGGVTYADTDWKGFVELTLINFVNEISQYLNRPFMYLVNTTILGKYLVPWDYYKYDNPKWHDSVVSVLKGSNIFLDINRFPDAFPTDGSVKALNNQSATGEFWSDYNIVKLQSMGNNSPQKDSGLRWGVNNARLINFSARETKGTTYSGFLFQKSNSESANQRPWEFGLDHALGLFFKRAYDEDEQKWKEEQVFREGDTYVCKNMVDGIYSQNYTNYAIVNTSGNIEGGAQRYGYMKVPINPQDKFIFVVSSIEIGYSLVTFYNSEDTFDSTTFISNVSASSTGISCVNCPVPQNAKVALVSCNSGLVSNFTEPLVTKSYYDSPTNYILEYLSKAVGNVATSSTRPSGVVKGYCWFDGNKPIWYKGKENDVDVWVDATGQPV